MKWNSRSLFCFIPSWSFVNDTICVIQNWSTLFSLSFSLSISLSLSFADAFIYSQKIHQYTSNNGVPQSSGGQGIGLCHERTGVQILLLTNLSYLFCSPNGLSWNPGQDTTRGISCEKARTRGDWHKCISCPKQFG